MSEQWAARLLLEDGSSLRVHVGDSLPRLAVDDPAGRELVELSLRPDDVVALLQTMVSWAALVQVFR